MRKILRTTALTLSLAFIFGGVFAQREVVTNPTNQVVTAKTVQPSAKLPTTLAESFEEYADFTTDLAPWTTLQVTSGDTWGSSDFDFAGEGTAFAFMVFNPSATDPAINGTHPAQDGNKYAVAVQYTSTNDNKWLISPKMMGTATTALSFYAKSMTDAYGLERIKVMISTTDTEPGSFTKISAGDYLEVPTTWTQYEYDLSNLNGQEFYFAINYVSYDAFFCMLDNFVVEGESSGFDVTFNVDMTGVGTDVFDPAAHKIFIAGSFPDATWNQPGSNAALEMTPVSGGSKAPKNFAESFETYDDFTTDLTPWTTLQVTSGDTWGASDFDFAGEGTAFAFMVFNPSATDPAINGTHPAQDGSKYAVAVQYNSTNDNKWLISPKLMGTSTSELSFYAKSMTDAYGLERIKVMISTTDTEPGSFTKISDGDYLEVPTTWTEYTYDLSAYAGQEFYFAINYVSYDAFFCMLDNFAVTSEEADDEPIYTITLNLPAGDYQYKYFVVKTDPSWDFGEWTGDPNRTVTVADAMTINDVWGVISSADEIANEKGVNLFPNPASTEIYVEHTSRMNAIRVFDVTGRMVYSAPVNGLTKERIELNSFNDGIYILQVIAQDGITSKKFIVRK